MLISNICLFAAGLVSFQLLPFFLSLPDRQLHNGIFEGFLCHHNDIGCESSFICCFGIALSFILFLCTIFLA